MGTPPASWVACQACSGLPLQHWPEGLSPAEAPPYANVFTWWRHAATHAALASAWVHSGLQASMTQLLPPELCGAPDGWAQEQAEKLFSPLHATTLPLSSAVFQTRMEQLHSDLAAQHTT